MKNYVKKYKLSKRLVQITVISLLLAPGSVKTVTASQPARSEPEAQQEDKPDIFQVSFPGDTEHVFDFIMDPQKLISQTNAAAYGGSVFEEDATLFFRRRDGRAEEDYSSSSDALVIANMGTADVELELTASISMEGIVMTDDLDFTDDMDASLYLALTDGEHTVAIGEEEGASIRTTLKGASGENGAVSEYRFWLTGAVNENGDWSEVEGAVPRVTVIWNITPHEVEEENQIQPEDAGLSTDEGEVEDAASGQSDLLQDSKDPGTSPNSGENTGQKEPEKPGESEPPDNSKEPQEEAEQKEPEPPGESISPESPQKPQENTDEKGSEPSGESTDPENPESPGENISSDSPEPSEEQPAPKGSGPSEEHGDPEAPEPSTEQTSPKEPKQSEGTINSNPLEPLEKHPILESSEAFEGNTGSKEPNPSAENTDAEEDEPFGRTDSLGNDGIT